MLMAVLELPDKVLTAEKVQMDCKQVVAVAVVSQVQMQPQVLVVMVEVAFLHQLQAQQQPGPGVEVVGLILPLKVLAVQAVVEMVAYLRQTPLQVVQILEAEVGVDREVLQ